MFYFKILCSGEIVRLDGDIRAKDHMLVDQASSSDWTEHFFPGIMREMLEMSGWEMEDLSGC